MTQGFDKDPQPSGLRSDDQRSPQQLLELAVNSTFRKYLYVWLWSIIFGANIGIGSIFINSYPLDGYTPLTFVIVLLTLIGGLFSLYSLVLMLNYLSRFLVPLLFKVQRKLEDEWEEQAARTLTQAVRFLIFAMGIQFIESALRLVFDALARSSVLF